MNLPITAVEKPTRVRFGVLGFACVLSTITYLDRVCFGTVAGNIQGEFGLTDTEKGILFSAFALAYASLEVPSGWLGDRFGPKKTLIRIVLAWSLFTVMTGLIYPSLGGEYLIFGLSIPFVAMVVVRFLFGAGEAGAYPNIARAFHNWFPYQERASAKGTVWMAGRFGGGITPFVVLALLYTTSEGGKDVTHWRHMFWIFGGFGVLWVIAFWWWFKDRPEQQPNVNAAELALIRQGEGHSGPARAVPWAKLMTSKNLWFLCLMYFCSSYGWYFNITWLPSYLRENFGLADQEKWSSGWLSFSLMAGAPLLLGAVGCLIGGILSDMFIKRTGNRKWGRRLFGLIGHGLCAVCYFAAIFAHSAPTFVLAIAMAAFWNDMTMGASWASCLDIGGKFSGIVAGCMNTVGNLGGFAAGFLTGMILDLYKNKVPAGADPATILNASQQGWNANFMIFAGVYVIATLLWLGFDATKPVAPEAIS
jgi:MFS transporter, ACS family, glucarate transporter